MMKQEHASLYPTQRLKEIASKRNEAFALVQKLLPLYGKVVMLKDGALLNSDKKPINTFDCEINSVKYRMVRSNNEVKQYILEENQTLKEVSGNIVFETLKVINAKLRDYEEECKHDIEEMLANYLSFNEAYIELQKSNESLEHKVRMFEDQIIFLGKNFPKVKQLFTEKFNDLEIIGAEYKKQGNNAIKILMGIIFALSALCVYFASR